MNEALTQGFGSIACSEQKRSAAYLGALPAKESICVTQPFQSENCPNSHLMEICDLHKGQLISKCPYEKSVWTKYQRKYFCPGSLLLQG